MARILAREEAGMVALVHDLIPIEYPEYARPSGAAIHRKRIATIARRADAIITNSAATRDALLPFLSAKMPRPVIRVAHLGTHGQGGRSPVRVTSERPYFVCVGTIEPRKNHLMLLNLWRALALEPAPPRLVLIGRRGWENEQVIDMLERCPALADHVEELSDLPDAQVWGLVAGARALLLPSFAEGYGMPVAEALALGVPVICSDLPALREVGGDAPTYLDPLDGPAWRRAIDAHGAHKDRTGVVRPWPGWKEPSWDDHIDTVLELAEQVA